MQALKSGQLPADFNVTDGDNAPKTQSESDQQDNMITDEKESDTETKESESAEKKDEASEMDEVVILLLAFILI